MGAPSNRGPQALQVRQACTEDALALGRLFVQLGYADARAGIEARLAQQLREPSASVFVAIDGAAVAGALVMHILAPLHVVHPWAVISALVVDEAQRAQGAGAALVAAAEAAAQAAGCAHMELSCSERRTGAHAFYEAQGFIEVRKRFVRKVPA